jgi:hypothetical protein
MNAKWPVGTTWCVVAGLVTALACRPTPPIRAVAVAPLGDSLTVQVPCAERLIVRNYGDSRRDLRLTLDQDQVSRITVRGEPNSRYGFFSRAVALPDGGAVGSIADGAWSSTFDSRRQPRCPASLGDSIASGVPIDLEGASSLFQPQHGSMHYPGLVIVTWRTPVDTAAVDAWVKENRGFYVHRDRVVPQLFVLWFDGDDPSASLAARRADALGRTSLARNARPMMHYP